MSEPTTATSAPKAAGNGDVAAEAALRASEARYRTLIESLDEGFCVIEALVDAEERPVDYRVLEANPAFLAQTGLTDVVGRRIRELAPAIEPHWFENYGRVVTTGEATRFEAPAAALGRWFDVYAFRVGEPHERQIGVLFGDISARKRAEADRDRLLREAEAAHAAVELERRRLLAVLEQLPVGVHVAEAPSGRLVLDNAAVRAICGDAPRSERVADYSVDYVGLYPAGHPRAGEPLASDAWPLARAIATGAPVTEELVEIRRADGTRRLVSVSATPVRDADGWVVGAVATNVDVTERQRLLAEAEAARAAAERTAAALAASEARFRAVVLQTPAPLALVEGPEHRFTLVNEAYKRVSGGGRDVTGLTPRTAFPELTGSGIHELFDRVFETGEPWEGRETPVRFDRDGTGVIDTWFDLRFEPVRDPDGRVVGVFNFCVDVTEQVLARRAVERALAESEESRARVTAVLESISDAFYAVDAEFRFTYVNQQAEALWGRRRAELVGRQIWTEFPAAIGSDSYRMHHQVMAERRPAHFETISSVLGRWIDVSLYPEAGGGIACYFRDVAARKDAEAERERLLAAAEAARAEAEAANRAKSEFLAVMSHELRTPLNAIGGYAELMEMGIRGPITAQQREDLRRLQASQRHLLGLINEVLNYARLETGAVHYELAEVRAREALLGAEALVAPQAQAKGLTLAVADCAPDVAVRADAEKLRQILVNLLSNAVKFTNAGGRVELACAASGTRVLVTVRDTGIGIAADQLQRIFDPFVQVRADLTRTAEGTGLGLAISRDLARGMGGDLTVESALGAGSTFTLALPRA